MVCDCAGTCEDEKEGCEKFYQVLDGVTICFFQYSILCPKSHRCIQKSFVCDGFYDCRSGEDGSDEHRCFQAPQNCSEDEFPCGDSRCLPKSVRCDFLKDCVGGEDELDCDIGECDQSTEFRCNNGQCINKQDRCNTYFDCKDRSDEIHCVNHTCMDGYVQCNSGQCIPQSHWCDFFLDCPDESDERHCEHTTLCTQDEFQCKNGQCIPKENICYNTGNRHESCADDSHLKDCRDWECHPSLHKCMYSYCINQSLVCDRHIDCWSSWTDEIGCPFVCSDEEKCECRDVSINCSSLGLHMLPANIEMEISKYYLSGNKLGQTLGPDMFYYTDGIFILDLSNNSIQGIPANTFKSLWRLRILYLQDNHIRRITNGSFLGLAHVATLNLERNNIQVIDSFSFYGLSSLRSLDLSHQRIFNVSQNAFIGLRSLLKLNLSYNKLHFLMDGSLNGLSELLYLDISRNRIQIMGSNVFRGLSSLNHLVTDEFRFCCLARHVHDCLPKADEFSSCEDLMSNIILRLCIWTLGLIAFTGNVLVIMWRLVLRSNSKIDGDEVTKDVLFKGQKIIVHSLLITNLAIGDMCMGIYLLIIAAIDYKYRGVYFIYDSLWRTSNLCQFAGFVSTFSSELSVFTLTIITVDRLIGIAFPFRLKRLQMKQTKIVMSVIWVIVLTLALLPLLPFDYFLHFYGRSGVCLALHITHDKPNGWEYSVFIFLALNLLSFLIIAAAYLWMFLVANRTQKAVRFPECKQDTTMAKRMSVIVFTDFCCWMPIIILGIMSLSGVTVPQQVFAWIAVFVLPLNAAVNPVLYTLSTAPFLGQTKHKVLRFRHSFLTSTVDTYRTSIHTNRLQMNGHLDDCHLFHQMTTSFPSAANIPHRMATENSYPSDILQRVTTV